MKYKLQEEFKGRLLTKNISIIFSYNNNRKKSTILPRTKKIFTMIKEKLATPNSQTSINMATQSSQGKIENPQTGKSDTSFI